MCIDHTQHYYGQAIMFRLFLHTPRSIVVSPWISVIEYTMDFTDFPENVSIISQTVNSTDLSPTIIKDGFTDVDDLDP